MMMANASGAAISMKYGLQGPNETICMTFICEATFSTEHHFIKALSHRRSGYWTQLIWSSSSGAGGGTGGAG
jgi:hypothetical protein